VSQAVAFLKFAFALVRLELARSKPLGGALEDALRRGSALSQHSPRRQWRTDSIRSPTQGSEVVVLQELTPKPAVVLRLVRWEYGRPVEAVSLCNDGRRRCAPFSPGVAEPGP
jgi:hypothetical protein